MFDAVLKKGSVPRSRFGTGAIISVGFHLALLGVALWLSATKIDDGGTEPDVRFVTAMPPPPPPAAAARARTDTAVKPRPVVKRDTLVQARDQNPTTPPEPVAGPQQDGNDDPTATPDGDPNAPGGPDSVPGGGEAVEGTRIDDVVPFGDGMTRPVADASNRGIHYSREALEAQVEGTMLLKCTITSEGDVRNCRIIKTLPHMDQSVLETVQAWHFAPVTFQGHAVSVDYIIPVRLSIPR